MITISYLCGSFLSVLGLIFLWIGLKKNFTRLSFIQQTGLLAVTLGIGITFFFNVISGILILTGL